MEIKVAGRWGTFCGIHGFRREDAIVICRMLNVQSPYAYNILVLLVSGSPKPNLFSLTLLFVDFKNWYIKSISAVFIRACHYYKNNTHRVRLPYLKYYYVVHGYLHVFSKQED